MKVVLGNHWCHTYRGGEKVLEQFRRLFPDAPLYTTFCRRGEIPDEILGNDIRTTFLNWVPGISRFYRSLLPLFPLALRFKSVRGADLFVNSDASIFKAIRVKDAFHICYCHSPPRYIWEEGLGYFESGEFWNVVKKRILGFFKPYLKRFDLQGANKVDLFIANSEFVRRRIEKFYKKDALVIYPPVGIERFKASGLHEDFYLIVSQIVPYKRVDIAVEACKQLGRKLVVVGVGTELERLKEMADKNVEFKGRCSDDEVVDLMSRCIGFIYPQIEDFGITAVEAQSSGRPVIAYREGGACETVLDGRTGVFFDEQTAASCSAAILQLESSMLDGRGNLREETIKACRENSLRFGEDRFRQEVIEVLSEHCPSVLGRF